jgi:hypothetical protein
MGVHGPTGDRPAADGPSTPNWTSLSLTVGGRHCLQPMWRERCPFELSSNARSVTDCFGRRRPPCQLAAPSTGSDKDPIGDFETIPRRGFRVDCRLPIDRRRLVLLWLRMRKGVQSKSEGYCFSNDDISSL